MAGGEEEFWVTMDEEEAGELSQCFADSSSTSSASSRASEIELMYMPSTSVPPGAESLSWPAPVGMAGAAANCGGAEPALGRALGPPVVVPLQIKPPLKPAPVVESKQLRHDAGQMSLETAIKLVCEASESPRPKWLLTDGTAYADLPGRIYIEHLVGLRGKNRKAGTDYWHATKKYPQPPATFNEDATGRRSQRTDASFAGTIEASRHDCTIVLRSPRWVGLADNEKKLADDAAEQATPLRADLWKLTLRYAGIEGTPGTLPKSYHLYHILPTDLRRVATREPMPRMHIGKRKLGIEAPPCPLRLASGVAVHDQSSEPQAAAKGSTATHESYRLPPTTIEDNRHDAKYLEFESFGKQIGAIERQNGGVTLSSSTGDFAEYYLRAEGEPEFEEGDVVGFVAEGAVIVISRMTSRAKLVGVISREMIVAGKKPDPREMHKYDTVAHVGQVPVKVRGHPIAGDVLVPSGRQDGTAVVSNASFHGQVLGSVVREPEPSGNTDEASDLHLVEVYVSIPDPFKRMVAAKLKQVARLLCTCVCCVLVVGVWEVFGAWRGEITASNHNRSPHIVTTGGCGAENVSAIKLVRCNACGSSDSTIYFEQQRAGDTVEVPCPVGFAGTMRRTCIEQNRSTLLGQCRRTECPRQHLELPGGTVLTVAAVAEGDSQVTICPEPGFSGHLTQQCLRNSTWGKQVGQCVRHMCSPSVEYFHDFVHTFNSSVASLYQSIPVKVPEAEYGRSVQVAVCRQFTRTGSCKDGYTAGDAGYIGLNCDSSGNWNLDGETSVFVSALSYDTLRMSKPLRLARSMYHTFVASVGTAVQPPRGSSWNLPVEGILTPVTIGLDSERREVFATAGSPTERADRSGSIDTNPRRNSQSMTERIHALAGGRAAAAFARVACAEFGFKDAPFVTSCQGLASLLDDLPYRPPDAINMLGELCPEIQLHPESGSECPNWLEVRDPPINDVANTQLDWLRAISRTSADDDGFHAAPMHEVAKKNEQTDWRDLKSFADVGPVPESPSCDGSEDSVLCCFQRQMIIPIARRKSWKRHCSRRIIVGCSNPVDPAPDDHIRPEVGAAILAADVKPLPDYSGFAVSVMVRPADFDFVHANLTIEAILTLHESDSTLADVNRADCPRITRDVPALISAFPRERPTSFKLQLAPQCRHIWSPYQPEQYQIVLRLHSFSTGSVVVDTLYKYAKLRSVTASDGTWVVGDSVRPYPDKSTPLTRPKIFVDTSGPFNCTTGDLATQAEIITSADRLCWGKTIV